MLSNPDPFAPPAAVMSKAKFEGLNVSVPRKGTGSATVVPADSCFFSQTINNMVSIRIS